MLRLWLLRHAKSAWDDPKLDDFARPLSPRGEKACRRLARHMSERGIRPDLVLCSPATRTRQTWERLEKRLAPTPPDQIKTRFEAKLYLAEAAVLLTVIRTVPATCREVLLIGHNPGLEDFARRLTGTSAGNALARLEEKYPTAGLAELCFPVENWPQVKPGAGFLASFVTPRQLDGERS
jgi:Phosphohistidine phosphatase SixA